MDFNKNTINDLELLAQRCSNMCDQEGWRRDWKEGGCYLHLEVSEFIESLRGKKGIPELEAADVLFVILAITKWHSIKIADVLKALDDVLIESETVKI